MRLEADVEGGDRITDLRINGHSVRTMFRWRDRRVWRPLGLWRRWRWYYALPALVAGMWWLGREVWRRRANPRP